MTALFQEVLDLSFSGSILICAVLLTRCLLSKAPRQLHCVLWMLVVLRLLIPFSVESPFSLQPDPEPQISYQQTVDIPQPPVELLPQPEAAPGIIQLQPQGVEPAAVAAYIWAAVSGCFLIYTFGSYLLLKDRVKGAAAVQKGIYESANISTAFILGYIRPKIYLPTGLLPENRGFILAHERSHLARGDHWFKLLGFLCLAVHWFNPLVWLAYSLLCRDIELACDEKVVREMEVSERKAYSLALLSCGDPHRSIAACPVAFAEGSMKQRIVSVLHYRKPGFWIMAASLTAAVLIAVCFLTDPISVAPSQEKSPETEQTLPTDPAASKATTAPTQPETTPPTTAPTQPETTPPTTAPTQPETTPPTTAPTQPETTPPTTAPTQPETTPPTTAPTQPETTHPTTAPTEPKPTQPPTTAPTTEPENSADATTPTVETVYVNGFTWVSGETPSLPTVTAPEEGTDYGTAAVYVGKKPYEVSGVIDAVNIEPGNNSADHTHTYAIQTKAPNCVYAGYDSHRCECGDYYCDNFVSAWEHKYVFDYVKEPGRGTEGYTRYECANCGDVQWRDRVEALPDFDFDALEEEIERYARNMGFQISDRPTNYAMEFSNMYHNSNVEYMGGEEYLLKVGKNFVNAAYNYINSDYECGLTDIPADPSEYEISLYFCRGGSYIDFYLYIW